MKKLVNLHRHQSGFTLVEMTVVLVVMVLFAALVVPNLITMRKSQLQRSAYGQVLDFLGEARIDAITQNTTFAVTWDSGTSAFDLKREPLPDQAGSNSLPSPEARPLQTATTINSFEQVKSLSLPAPIQADTFRIGNNTSDPGSFALHFYANGTSDGGGFQLTQGNSDVRSVSVDKFGIATPADGPLPDATDQTWTAGTYAQKI